MDFVKHWADCSEITRTKIVDWTGVERSRFFEWIKRYGKANEHNGQVPRDHWILPEEKQKIVEYHAQNPLNGYRRLTFMMLDEEVVAVSPKTTYRVLKEAGVLDKKGKKTSSKGKGFNQPTRPHEHWHVDVSYINICGTFYYLCSVLDGYSRYVVHWDIRESMKEEEIEVIVEKARESALEKYPDASPRIISDNGPQFVSREFKSYIRLTGMDHVRTSPYYPQSNGKLERWHKEYKQTCVRAQTIRSLAHAKELTTKFVDDYNHCRLHAAIGYVAPIVKLEGREEEVHKIRDKRLEEARKKRAEKRRALKKMEEIPTERRPSGGYGSAGEQPERQGGRGGQNGLAFSDAS